MPPPLLRVHPNSQKTQTRFIRLLSRCMFFMLNFTRLLTSFIGSSSNTDGMGKGRRWWVAGAWNATPTCFDPYVFFYYIPTVAYHDFYDCEYNFWCTPLPDSCLTWTGFSADEHMRINWLRCDQSMNWARLNDKWWKLDFHMRSTWLKADHPKSDKSWKFDI